MQFRMEGPNGWNAEIQPQCIEQSLCGPNLPFAFSDVSRLQVARFNARWYARQIIGKGGSACL
jgi:hypothetical protein